MNKNGFTMVELLTALSIFLVGLAVFARLLILAERTVEKNMKLYISLNQTRNMMEELRTKNFNELASASFASGEGKVVVQPMAADIVSIKVELGSVVLYGMRSK